MTDRDERQRLEALAVRAYPHEACGVVMERGDVRVLLNCVNVAPEEARGIRFQIGPGDLAQIATLTQAGYLLDTIWHSHPDHPPTFSAVDRAQAMAGDAPLFPWATHKIVAVTRDGVGAWSAVRWSDAARDFVEVPAWREPPARLVRRVPTIHVSRRTAA